MTMAIALPTGKVQTTAWAYPLADEVNRLTTESGTNKTNLASIETSLNQLLTPAWKTLPLSSGWDNFGSGQQNANYVKWGNWVFVRGLVKNVSGAAVTANTTYSTVPSEIQMPLNALCALIALSSSSNAVSLRTTLQSNGNHNIIGTSTRPIPNNNWFSLEGLNYFLG